MEQVGIPLNWFRLLDIPFMKKHKNSLPISFENFDRNQKIIYSIASENI